MLRVCRSTARRPGAHHRSEEAQGRWNTVGSGAASQDPARWARSAPARAGRRSRSSGTGAPAARKSKCGHRSGAAIVDPGTKARARRASGRTPPCASRGTPLPTAPPSRRTPPALCGPSKASTTWAGPQASAAITTASSGHLDVEDLHKGPGERTFWPVAPASVRGHAPATMRTPGGRQTSSALGVSARSSPGCRGAWSVAGRGRE